jgi:cellulose synthase/poly-beta-1,6-N-acetylglucosamine synthase-like glycosyltransferase
MNANKWIRQSHRWLSISFTLMVLANLAVMGRGDVALWIGALTLVPLFLLLFSGLYLFVLPYLARWRSARSVSS